MLGVLHEVAPDECDVQWPIPTLLITASREKVCEKIPHADLYVIHKWEVSFVSVKNNISSWLRFLAQLEFLLPHLLALILAEI